jgi:hypothetical protein
MKRDSVRPNERVTTKKLVSSLSEYVEPDDVRLPRELFLRALLDRIVNDLSRQLPRQAQSARTSPSRQSR